MEKEETGWRRNSPTASLRGWMLAQPFPIIPVISFLLWCHQLYSPLHSCAWFCTLPLSCALSLCPLSHQRKEESTLLCERFGLDYLVNAYIFKSLFLSPCFPHCASWSKLLSSNILFTGWHLAYHRCIISVIIFGHIKIINGVDHVPWPLKKLRHHWATVSWEKLKGSLMLWWVKCAHRLPAWMTEPTDTARTVLLSSQLSHTAVHQAHDLRENMIV